MRLALLLIPLGLFAPLTLCAPDDPPEDVFFESTSGQYELEVRCDEESLGCKPSVMTMRRDSLVIWSRGFDHTFKDAAVSDSGRVIGAFYHSDWRHDDILDPDQDNRGIWVATLDQNGTELSTVSHPDMASAPGTFLYNPAIVGLTVFDQESNAIVRTRQLGNLQHSAWWIHDLTTGQVIDSLSPVLAGLDEGWGARELLALEFEHAPLILVHWVVYEFGDTASHARISLHDSSGRSLWEKQIENDYTDLGMNYSVLFRSARNRTYFETPIYVMKKPQLQMTKNGFQFHSISKNEITEYQYQYSDGVLEVQAAGVRPMLYELGIDEE